MGGWQGQVGLRGHPGVPLVWGGVCGVVGGRELNHAARMVLDVWAPY